MPDNAVPEALMNSLVAAHSALDRMSHDGAQGPVNGQVARKIAAEVAAARNAAAAAEFHAENLASWRGVKVGIALAESSSPRRLLGMPRRLWRAMKRQSAPVAPEPVTTEQVVAQLGIAGAGLRRPVLPYPHLRVIHWGPARTFAGVVPHHDVAPDIEVQAEAGADLFLVEAGYGDDTAGLEEAAAAMSAAGIPVVLFARTAGHLDVNFEVDLVLTESPQLAAPAGRQFDRVALLAPSVDTAIYNPVEWQRDPDGIAAAFVGVAPSRPELGDDRQILFEATDASVFATPWATRPRFPVADESLEDPYAVAATAKRHRVVVESAALHVDEVSYLRQMLRLAATGTPIITTGSPHLGDVIEPELVSVVASPDEARAAVSELADPVARERASVRLRRHVLSNHTTRHRFEEVLDHLNIPKRRHERISIMFVTNRPDFLAHAYANFFRQDYPDLELITVLHGDQFGSVSVDELNEGCDFPTTVIAAPSQWTLGDCLNAAIEAATGHFVTKMDDDDFYGPHHLSDLVLAHAYSGADIVGKRVNFVYLADLDLLSEWGRGNEEALVRHLPGATMLMEREVALVFRYPRLSQAEDSDLIARVMAAGGALYSTHPFNFVRHRHGDHSFDRPDAFFMAEGRVWKDPDIESLAYT